MRKFYAQSILLIACAILFLSAVTFFIEDASAQAEVELEGVVVSDEVGEEFGICYGMPHCKIVVEKILFDPNDTLEIGQIHTICYDDPLNLTINDKVRCRGDYWIYGPCPFQYCFHITCTEITIIYAIGGSSTSIEIGKTYPWVVTTALLVVLLCAKSLHFRRKGQFS